MDHMKSFPSFTNPSKVIDTSSESFWKKIYFGYHWHSTHNWKNTNVGYKIQQISSTFTREFIGIVLNNMLMTIHDSLRITFMRAWKFLARVYLIRFWRARILYYVWACARAHFPFFRANMNLVCTKCNGARVFQYDELAHINVMDEVI